MLQKDLQLNSTSRNSSTNDSDFLKDCQNVCSFAEYTSHCPGATNFGRSRRTDDFEPECDLRTKQYRMVLSRTEQRLPWATCAASSSNKQIQEILANMVCEETKNSRKTDRCSKPHPTGRHSAYYRFEKHFNQE